VQVYHANFVLSFKASLHFRFGICVRALELLELLGRLEQFQQSFSFFGDERKENFFLGHFQSQRLFLYELLVRIENIDDIMVPIDRL